MKINLTKAGAYTNKRIGDLPRLFEFFDKNQLNYFEGMIARNIADILLHQDDTLRSDAELWIRKAIEADARNGTRWYLASNHVLYADWFKKAGNLSSAKEQLVKAVEIFRECGADGWVNKYEQNITSLP
jgi:hypothetical protein